MKTTMWGMADEPKTDEPTKAPKLTVESIDNHVYYYAKVDEDRVLAMIKKIRETDSILRNEYISRSLPAGTPPTPIWLHIQSPGGYLFSGFSAADQLQSIATPIYSIVEGYCASAGTLISIACTKRFILPNAFMLIHQLSNIMWGKYEEFKDEMHLMDMLMEKLTNFYVPRTKMKEEQVKKLLERDSWFNAKKCIKLGLVDEILGEEK